MRPVSRGTLGFLCWTKSSVSPSFSFSLYLFFSMVSMGDSGGNSSLVQDLDASPSPGGRVLLPFGAGFLLPSGPLCISVVALFSPFLSDLFVFLPEGDSIELSTFQRKN